jgi:hypothetical protein
MFRAERVAVHLRYCEHHRAYEVVVEPVTYLGRDEFRRVASVCRRHFMELARYWAWIRGFKTEAEARAFVEAILSELGERCFYDAIHSKVVVVPPKRELTEAEKEVLK